MDKDNIFPTIKKGLEDFIQEEEGNISRSKVAMIGSMMVILGVMLADGSVYAAHRSHSSHSSGSHSSGSSKLKVSLPKMQIPQSTPDMY